MKTKLLVLFLLAGCSLFARGRFSVAIGIGAYPYPYYAPAPVYYGPPAPVVAWRPPCPGPGYSWVSATGIPPDVATSGVPVTGPAPILGFTGWLPVITVPATLAALEAVIGGAGGSRAAATSPGRANGFPG